MTIISEDEKSVARDREGVLARAIKVVNRKFRRKDVRQEKLERALSCDNQMTLNSTNLYAAQQQEYQRREENDIEENQEPEGGNDDIDYDISILSDEMSTVDDASLLFAEPPQKQSHMMSIVVGAFVAVGGFLFGYDTGLINSIVDMRYVRENIAPNHVGFTAQQLAILVSFLSLGTFVGALSAPVISDKYGRKKTIMFSTAVVFSLGNSLQVGAHNIQLLIAGRVISGLGVGLVSAVVPLYQAEAAHKSLRGAIISTYQWAITWGLLVSSAVSQGTHNRNDASSYRIPIGLQYVWAYILAAGMLWLPESPRYYVLRDQLDKAAQSLSFLRGVPIHDSGLLEELVEIKATFDYESSFGKTTFWDCFKSNKSRPKQTLRMFTGIAIQAFQQFSGINFIFYYGVSFFNRSGVENSYIVSLITYAVNVGFSVPGMFLVEYFGRRSVLLYGGAIMTLSNFIIAIVGSSTQSVVANKVMIAFICLFIASFAATWGGVVWVISAELYPLGVRAKCTAICAAANWLINFVCAFITPYIVDTGERRALIGPKIYFIWGSLNALGILVVYFTVYETRGLTLEEIDELYTKSPHGIVSAKWNRRIRHREKTYGHKEQQNRDRNQQTTKENLRKNVVNEDMLSDDLTPRNDSINTHHSVDSNEKYQSENTDNTLAPAVNDRSMMDFGNDMILHICNRGPPSISTAASVEEFGGNSTQMENLSYNESNSVEKKKVGLFSKFKLGSRKSSINGTEEDSKPKSPQLGQAEFSPSPLDVKVSDDDHNDFVDLGNGFGLYSVTRRLSSGVPDTSDEESAYDLGNAPSSTNTYRNRGNLDSINTYMSQLIQSNTYTSQNTGYSQNDNDQTQHHQ